jgi:hypothetical protein
VRHYVLNGSAVSRARDFGELGGGVLMTRSMGLVRAMSRLCIGCLVGVTAVDSMGITEVQSAFVDAISSNLSTGEDLGTTLSLTNNSSSTITAMILKFEQWSSDPAKKKSHMKTVVHYDGLLSPSQHPIGPGETFRYHYGGYGHPGTGNVSAVLFADGSYWGDLDGIRSIASKRKFFVAGYQEAFTQYESITSAPSPRADLKTVLDTLTEIQKSRAKDAQSQEEKYGLDAAYSTLIDNLRLSPDNREGAVAQLRLFADRLSVAVSSAKIPHEIGN